MRYQDDATLSTYSFTVIPDFDFRKSNRWIEIVNVCADKAMIQVYFGEVGWDLTLLPKLELGNRATDWTPA